jgi:hypothetical protein
VALSSSIQLAQPFLEVIEIHRLGEELAGAKVAGPAAAFQGFEPLLSRVCITISRFPSGRVRERETERFIPASL